MCLGNFTVALPEKCPFYEGIVECKLAQCYHNIIGGCFREGSGNSLGYDESIRVKFCFDSQFAGKMEKVAVLPEDITDEQIKSKFPEVLGLDYDDNCWFERITN